MKFIPSQLLFFLQNKTTRKNFVVLAKFFGFLCLIILLYSALFHMLMLYEGREFSWITGLYWTLTVMSTLGFGDITFHTDLGLLFTILVLSSGMILLLIMLPFCFIQFFYAPWLDALAQSRTPRFLPESVRNHVIITNIDPITEKLVGKLVRRHFEYVVIVPDPKRAEELHDAGYKVVIGEPDDPETFRKVRGDQAALVVATQDDLLNTSVAFTVREISRSVPIVVSADHVNSLDILEFPGNTHVFQFARMLGNAMAERTLGIGRPVNIVSSFDTLHIAEISAAVTSLGGKTLQEADVRHRSGATVVGLWDKGRFEIPHPQTRFRENTLLLLAGTTAQLDMFERSYVEKSYYTDSGRPVIILGCGRVGLAVAEKFDSYGVDYRVVDKKAVPLPGVEKRFIQGDAADIAVLEAAGVREAKTAIITTHSDAMNIYLTFYCRQLRPEIQIVSRAIAERSVSKLHMAGADIVLSWASMGANAIINVLKNDEITMYTEGLNIFSRPMPGSLVGKNLAQSSIRETSGCSVIALKTAGELTVGPDPHKPLARGDELILIGTTEAEQKFLEGFS